MSLTSIYGRDTELEQIRQLLSRHRSFLLHGSSGMGKTLLLSHLAGELPEMLYCAESTSSQTVFRALAEALLAKNNRYVVKACAQRGLNAIREKSAVSLRGIVTEALREKSYWLVLDHLQAPSQSFAAAIKDVWGRTETPLIASARSAHMEDVGFLLPFFSDRSQRFALRNFTLDVAADFALRIAGEIRLEAVNRSEAIHQIVRYSRGNPGAIVAMLQMAASPKYVAQQHVKLSPLYIDFRLGRSAIHG
jgi:AAA ATPase domain